MLRIKNIRKFKGYSQYQIAQKLALSQNAYSKLELGRSNLTLDKLFDIADILETDVVDFFESNSHKIERIKGQKKTDNLNCCRSIIYWFRYFFLKMPIL
ncbi:helix-turn-helix domain-containing protein [Pedobacter sp. PWIIR3]